ncbi:MAG TPA: amino acid adenylation domain-containing protein, partial [Polyangiaceae bacterium]|nr:amino acid adenylation domain-containing protein [Polyangiaceae bacterium]
MRPLSELLAQLRARRVSLRWDGSRLSYEAPAGMLDADLAQELRSRRDELVELLRSDVTSEGSRQQAERSTAPERARCSAQQRSIWAAQSLGLAGPAFHMAFALHLEGALDPLALRYALDAVLERHQILRTRLIERDGELMQTVDAAAPVELTPTDVSTTALAALIERPFGLASEHPIRVRLERHGPSRHALYFVVHHIAMDGWSLSILARELSEAYAERVAGVRRTEQRPALQYWQYAEWQASHLNPARVARAVAFFGEELAGAPAGRPVFRGHERLGPSRYRGAWHPIELEAELTTNLGALATRCRSSLYAVLLAAFSCVLAKHGAGLDWVIGTAVANRTPASVADSLGMFANTLPVRVQLASDPRLVDFVRDCASAVLRSKRYEDVPIDMLVQGLNTEGPSGELGGARSWPFQVLFAYDDSYPSQFELAGLSTRVEPVSTGTAKYDLTLSLARAGSGLTGWLEYDSDQYRATDVARLAQAFRAALNQLLAAPETRYRDLDLLSAQDRALLLREEGHAAPAPPSGTLVELLTRAFGVYAERTAVEQGDETLSYGQLEARSGAIARALRKAGVSPGSHVAVFLDRAPSLLCVLVGVLRAGAAYVPLDPRYPEARLRRILERSRASCLVASPKWWARGMELGARITLDAEQLLHASGEAGELPQAAASQPAYVLYTSGSSGEPKGVELSQGNARSFVDWALAAYAPQELRGVWAGTSLGFDLSVFELFATLCGGGTVLLTESPIDPPVGKTQPTLINTVPSVLRELLETHAIPGSVVTINSAGEVLPRDLCHALWSRTAIRRLVNLYGPTETTTYVTASEITRAADSIAIGRPLPNASVLLLDEFGERVPPEVTGEIYVAGAAVATGYLHEPRQTAERFVPHAESGAHRMYRTGDYAYRDSSGELHYLGRRDAQLKVRGHRVEAAELECLLRSSPKVRDAVVVLPDGSGPAGSLVAFVVPTAADPNLESELRQELAKRLPAALVPGAFFQRDTLPKTSSSKYARRALAREAGLALLERSSATAPLEGYIEQTLAQIWCRVLGVAQVGPDQNFFELGGHSLSAVRVACLISQELGSAVQGQALFEYPVLRDLSRFMQSRMYSTAGEDQIEALLREVEALSDAEV